MRFMNMTKPMNVVVIGGSRGIGLGLVTKYLSLGHQVIATHRNNSRRDGLQALREKYPERLKLAQLEMTDYGALPAFKEQLPEKIDILILNAGVMLCPPGSIPQTETVEEMRTTMETNAFAPDQIMRVLYPKLLHPNACAVYMSSTLSSPAENLKGRYSSYRASKIAGNMLFQNWNISLAKDWLEAGKDLESRPIAFPISPGVVQTDMGGPTSPLTVEESVTGMVQVITEVRRHKQSGLYLYDGRLLQGFPEPEVVGALRKQVFTPEFPGYS